MTALNPNAARYTLKAYTDADRRWEMAEVAAARATQMLAATPASRLGALKAAPRLHSDPAGHLLQIRSAPLEELAGAEMRYIVPGGKPGRKYLELLTQDLVGTAQGFWSRRADAAALAARASSNLSLRGGGTDPRYPNVTAIGVAGGSTAKDPFEIVFDLQLLGSGMVWTIETVRRSQFAGFGSELMDHENKHSKFADLLSALRANRIRGRIETTAVGVLDFVRMKLDDALDHLTRRNELVFDFSGYRCQLYWDDGTLRCDVAMIDDGWSLARAVLWLHASLPDVLSDSLKDRRLGEVVFNEFLPADAVIAYAQARPDDLHVMWLEIPTIRLPDPDDVIGRMMRERLVPPGIGQYVP